MVHVGQGGAGPDTERDAQPIITVFGSSQPAEGDAEFAEAYELGRRLALAGYVLCNGGSGGTMRASAQGAREAGGRTIGITMDVYQALTSPPNSYLDEEVRVADLFVRLQQLILPASGFVCLRGGCGTLSEWTLVWTLLTSGLIPPVPLVLLGQQWRPLLDAIRAGMLPRERDWAFLQVARDIDETLELLQAGAPAVPPVTRPLG